MSAHLSVNNQLKTADNSPENAKANAHLAAKASNNATASASVSAHPAANASNNATTASTSASAHPSLAANASNNANAHPLAAKAKNSASAHLPSPRNRLIVCTMSDLHLLLPSPIHILQETITAEAAVVAVTVTAVEAAAVT